MKHQVICADPPWAFDDKLAAMHRETDRSAESHYDVMSIDDIKNLPVQSIADPEGCILVCWVPGSLLQEGLDVVKSWGFKQKQIFVWVKLKKDHEKEKDANKKTRVGMGRLFRQSHEIALVATGGKSVYKHLKNKGQTLMPVGELLAQANSTWPPESNLKEEPISPAH